MKSFKEFLYVYYDEESDNIDIACYTYLRPNKPSHYFACNLNNICKEANDFDKVKRILLKLIC